MAVAPPPQATSADPLSALPEVATRAAATSQEESAVGKVIRRLIPFIFLCYLIAYIDRVNIGFAKSALLKDLGIGHDVFGTGAGLFFLGYFAFEIPSNLILEKIGARRWISRIMITWGLVSMAFVFVQGKASFYGMRVLLGLAEAGFFPGIVLYLTYWVPARYRAKTGALFMMAIPVAMLVAAPVSAALLKMDGVLGLRGWQWLFLVEGLPAVILGVLALRYLTDTPDKATWLPAADRQWLTAEMARERAERQKLQKPQWWQALFNPKMLLLTAFYFLNNAATYGIFLFLPDILAQKSGYTGFTLAAVTAVPFAFALAGMILIGRHSDRTGERKWHVAACAATAATGLALAALFQDNVVLLILCITLSQTGQRSILGPFWSIPPIFLGGATAAAGIALVNSLGTLGGYFGPDIMGKLRQSSSGYTTGLVVLAGALALEAILIALIRLPRQAAAPAKSPAPPR